MLRSTYAVDARTRTESFAHRSTSTPPASPLSYKDKPL
jgi:hypothetical protein